MGGMWDNQETIFLMENFKEESQLEIRNRDFIIIDSLFPTLYSQTKQPYQSGLRVWEIGA